MLLVVMGDTINNENTAHTQFVDCTNGEKPVLSAVCLQVCSVHAARWVRLRPVPMSLMESTGESLQPIQAKHS